MQVHSSCMCECDVAVHVSLQSRPSSGAADFCLRRSRKNKIKKKSVKK